MSSIVWRPQDEILRFLYKEMAETKANPEVYNNLAAEDYVWGILSDFDIQLLKDNYAEAVDACLSIDAGNKFDAEFTMPYEIAEFLYGLLGKPKGVEFFNPFSGLCSFPLAFKGNHFVCQEKNLDVEKK